MAETEIQNPFAPPRADVAHPPPVDAGQRAPAGRGERFLAFCIDSLPGVACGIVAALVHLDMSFLAFGAAGLVVWFAVNVFWLYERGQSVGKRVLGLRVVRVDGSRVSFKRFFFLRGAPIAILGAIPFLGWLIQIADPLLIFRESRQCLHDMFADTLVVTAESSTDATLAGSAGSDGGPPDTRT